jgi:DNA-binding transcriptional LysR family regulator
MELAWLEDFVMLVGCGQFSQAAERRSISQSGFSRRIRSLEEWVGTPLFERDPRGVRLTAAGEQFRPLAEDALRKIQLAREQARETVRAGSGTLKFAATHALSLTFFPRWLRNLNATTVLDATVSLVADNMVACERIMLGGRAQFLLCHHHPSATTALKPDQFISCPLGQDVLVPVCVPRTDKPSLPLHPLPGSIDHPLSYLAYSTESGMGRILAQSLPLKELGFAAKPVFTSHVAAVLLAMARDGHGTAWLPISLVADDLATGKLVVAGDETWNIPVEIHLFRAKARQTKAVEELWSVVTNLEMASSWKDRPLEPEVGFKSLLKL